jgi:hypothetical protein
MSVDDDRLEVDLSAWQAPPPPPGVAEAVVARMRDTTGAGAIDLPDRRRRWGSLAIPTIAAVVVASVIGFMIWPRAAQPEASFGEVAATRPAHASLGGASRVELDPAAAVQWWRVGDLVVASQPRGAATWTVAAGDSLVMHTGAAVASVRASGATLRVEVHMFDRTDARVIGASAVTAAAVALVTVLVYEGTVRVTGRGETVEVASGGVVEVRLGEAPVTPALVGSGAPDERSDFELIPRLTIDELRERVARQDREIVELRRELVARDVTIPTCDPDAERRARAYITSGQHSAALAEFEKALPCKPGLTALTYMAACRARQFRRAKQLFHELPEADQAKPNLAQMCLSEGFDPR